MVAYVADILAEENKYWEMQVGEKIGGKAIMANFR